MKHYYIRYEPKAEINYIYLLYLYSLGEYNTTKKCFDTISHDLIIKELKRYISDKGFIDLVYKLLRIAVNRFP